MNVCFNGWLCVHKVHCWWVLVVVLAFNLVFLFCCCCCCCVYSPAGLPEFCYCEVCL